MQETGSINALRGVLREWRLAGRRLAFVPTMGNLHAGHLRLVEEAKKRADRVVVSIFVNPLQFSAGEDFAKYPRTLDDDRRVLRELDTDLLFVPLEAELYPSGREATTRVRVPGISDILCGTFRPGHFEGVATVVAKLFNLVQPDIAVFGKKDFQQLLVIRRMVAELDFPVEIAGVKTVREPDGLAMSSRNRYLTPDERGTAILLHETLRQIGGKLVAGARDFDRLQSEAMERLNGAGFTAEYVEIRRREDLQRPCPEDTEWVVLAATRLGSARLIDNLEIAAD